MTDAEKSVVVRNAREIVARACILQAMAEGSSLAPAVARLLDEAEALLQEAEILAGRKGNGVL